MFGWTARLSPTQTAEIASSKQVVYDGFKSALQAGVTAHRAGILVDEQGLRAAAFSRVHSGKSPSGMAHVNQINATCELEVDRDIEEAIAPPAVAAGTKCTAGGIVNLWCK